MTCRECKQCEPVSVYVDGKYTPNLCRRLLSGLQSDSAPNSAAASFDRRRQYEEHAQDTVQPYNASGPNAEFARLYPKQAEKIFTKDELEQVKRKL